MLAKISKWGNSQALRVPKDIIKNLNIQTGDEVDISIKNKQIIIKCVKNRNKNNKKIKYNLAKLLAQLPDDYQAKEMLTDSYGKELW